MPRKPRSLQKDLAPPAGPPPKRRTLYFGEWAEKVIGRATNPSGTMERLCRRHALLLMYATPIGRYTVGEWAVLVMALKEGVGLMEFEAWRTVAGWAHLYREDVIERYGVDPVEVARKLRAGGVVENIVVCELVDSYWAIRSRVGHTERLEGLGLITEDEGRAWDAEQAARNARHARKEESPPQGDGLSEGRQDAS